MKYIITTDHEEQGWLNSFNDWANFSYKMNQEVKEEDLDSVRKNIYRFNNELACGRAIRLFEQEGQNGTKI
ncbi:hypothetical protein [Enterococcus sp. DIV0802b]|uniref:hypothetical protein n=1 Tax=Enterococcus sp. DIV0802b TaxID=2774704 RepID=UPI003D2FC54F